MSSVDPLMSRPAQLNCIANIGATNVIRRLCGEELPDQEPFPMESIAVFVGMEKKTLCTTNSLRFYTHRKLSRKEFHRRKILPTKEFLKVAWSKVYAALYDVPRVFAIWACKQVMGVAGTNLFQSKYKKEQDPVCPSCGVAN